MSHPQRRVSHGQPRPRRGFADWQRRTVAATPNQATFERALAQVQLLSTPGATVRAAIPVSPSGAEGAVALLELAASGRPWDEDVSAAVDLAPRPGLTLLLH